VDDDNKGDDDEGCGDDDDGDDGDEGWRKARIEIGGVKTRKGEENVRRICE
jgi:hypothetical protein